jgi:pimeloyl-ACP methyl ester carboxylesterase
MPTRREFFESSALIALGTPSSRLEAQNPAGSTTQRTREELVTVRTQDGLVMTGLQVTPERQPSRRLAVIWIHGAGTNFYLPSYVAIARATASLGYPFITGNTRMHDIGSVLTYQPAQLRGGSYWGLPSKEPLDIAAWVAHASVRGYREVVLVGHSAGGPAARGYLAQREDARVVGFVMASVGVDPSQAGVEDPERLKIARDMVANGRPADFLPNLRLSAATYVDYADTPPEMRDFYGAKTQNPAITRIRCPLLAWFGSKEPDIGTAADLQRLRELIGRHPQGPARVDTRIVEGADHFYAGQESQVAKMLVDWITRLPAKASR